MAALTEPCRRLKWIERGWREGVSEMLRESIDGLDSSSYHVDLTPHDNSSEWLHQAIAMEKAKTLSRWGAAAKMPVQEIVVVGEEVRAPQ